MSSLRSTSAYSACVRGALAPMACPRCCSLLIFAAAMTCSIIYFSVHWPLWGKSMDELAESPSDKGGQIFGLLQTHLHKRTEAAKVAPSQQRQKVVMSVAVGQNARKADYLALLPITALNWNFKGFHPVILVVKPSHMLTAPEQLILATLSKMEQGGLVSLVWYTLAEKDRRAAITLAQVLRVFAPGEFGRPGDYIRTTDADMLLCDSLAFQPSVNSREVHIFNGRCERGGDCFVPIHSLGMFRELWVNLFNSLLSDKGLGATSVASTLAFLESKHSYDGSAVVHGGRFWGLDQDITHATLSEYAESNRSLIKSVPLASRIHIGDNIGRGCVDAHMAGFTVAKDSQWLSRLVLQKKLIPASRHRFIENLFRAFSTPNLKYVEWPHCEHIITFYDSSALHHTWWKNIKHWETYTQALWCEMIDAETIYVGFGEWIGPTAILAGALGKRAYALEPDPRAFDAMLANIQTNPALPIEASRYCVSDKKESIVMAVGASSSSVLKRVRKTFVDSAHKHMERILVECNTLPHFLEAHNLNNNKLFLKMDVEGDERYIVPSWKDWLRTFGDKKPMLSASYHSTLSGLGEAPEELAAHCDILNTYRYKYYTRWNAPSKDHIAVTNLTPEILKQSVNIFVSDSKPLDASTEKEG